MLPNLRLSVYEGECVGAIVFLLATLHIIPVWLSSYLLKLGTSWVPARGTMPCLTRSARPIHQRHCSSITVKCGDSCLSSGRKELFCIWAINNPYFVKFQLERQDIFVADKRAYIVQTSSVVELQRFLKQNEWTY